MVALVITLILLAGIGQIFLSSKKSFTIQNALGRQQENGRYVLDTLAQDLRRAGYLGGALKIEETGWSMPVATGADTCANSTRASSVPGCSTFRRKRWDAMQWTIRSAPSSS